MHHRSRSARSGRHSKPFAFATAALIGLATAVSVSPAAQAVGETVEAGAIETPGSPIYRVSLTDRGTFQIYSTEFGQTFWGLESERGAYATLTATNPAESVFPDVATGTQTFGGSGSAVDPFWIQTVDTSGSMPLTTRLSYVIGSNYVRTDISTTNVGAQARTVELAGYGDCYLAGDDLGYSNVVPGRAVECHTQQAGGDVITLLAATPGAVAVAGLIQPIAAAVRGTTFITDSAMANTCVPGACMTERVDNGGALAWKRDVAPGETFSVSYLNAYTDAVNPPFSDLAVDASASTTQAALGDQVSYTVSVRNDGPADTSNVDLSFPIPAGMTFLDADQAGYDASTGSWAVGDLPSGSTKTIVLRAQADRVGTVTAQVLSATSINIDATPCVTGSAANCGPALSLNVVAVPAAATSTIGVSPSSIPADGSTASTVTVT
ncbi:DUF11 domain-containing protein, partial [Leifsonia sp. NPDC102414]|uniref:DUF11 domain-containing protein n=1 Tax=Leifsonia sp. NPDC102414 TaxID=3364124 RepID=UPI003821FDA0